MRKKEGAINHDFYTHFWRGQDAGEYCWQKQPLANK